MNIARQEVTYSSSIRRGNWAYSRRCGL